jgi:hypothetical protein
METDTKVDRILKGLKNHPILALIMTAGAIIIALSTFIDALRKLLVMVPSRENYLELVALDLITEPELIRRYKASWLIGARPEDDSFPQSFWDKKGSGTFPLVDVKLRNTGPKTVLLHSLEIDVIRAEVEPHPSSYFKCKPLPPTWEYNVLLNDGLELGEGAKRLKVELSQVIYPNEADRFVVTLGQTQYLRATYELDLTLRFNKDERLNMGHFRLVVAGPPPCDEGWKLDTVRRPSGSTQK